MLKNAFGCNKKMTRITKVEGVPSRRPLPLSMAMSENALADAKQYVKNITFSTTLQKSVSFCVNPDEWIEFERIQTHHNSDVIFSTVFTLAAPDSENPVGHKWSEGAVSSREPPLSAVAGRALLSSKHFRGQGKNFLEVYEMCRGTIVIDKKAVKGMNEGSFTCPPRNSYLYPTEGGTAITKSMTDFLDGKLKLKLEHQKKFFSTEKLKTSNASTLNKSKAQVVSAEKQFSKFSNTKAKLDNGKCNEHTPLLSASNSDMDM